MSELSPKASALLAAARKAPRAPSNEAVERMERAVLVATGVTAAAAGAGAAKTASAWALSATGKGVLGAVALTLVGATVTVSLIARSSERAAASASGGSPPVARQVAEPALKPTREDVAAPPDESQARRLVAAQAPVEVERETGKPAQETVAAPVASQGGARAPKPGEEPAQKPVEVAPPRASVQASVPRDAAQPQLTPPPAPPLVGLGSEVALLQSAKAKLDAGDWAAVQTLLDQHHAEFPGGALSLEADVLRVLAWCGDGHHAEASELAARVRERAPRAPATARLSGSCVDQ